ncbi:MAG: TonB-dependent receptor [Salibacter sp.]|uniref:TonB-dependent receptor n=1 Tax=Salibacter sp. TaxID=2010995 RepID=UPI00287096F9|nr:TonB-dependent receptor [Salibacter sp.]MDR9399744.1 TonB-dependent receptor [Salibacter sp.]
MKRKLHLCSSFFIVLFSFGSLIAQDGKVTGKIVDASTNESLPGANVIVEGTSIGTISNIDGEFKMKAPSNNFTLVFRFVGYKTVKKSFSIDKDGTDLGTITLEPGANELSTVEIVASRSTSETPFTFTDLEKKEIEQNLGSRDLPNVLNLSPSVYSTNQGGGAGDSRLNVRGFDQENVAVMINGVPVNDMENGNVYWSNWDGLGDAAASIQVQRGISPVNISVPSVGGTVNIITDPAARSKSISLRQEVGSWNFKKTTLQYNSGLIDDKFALSANVVRKKGDGFYDGTFTDAWAYYLGASYKISDKDKLELYAVGAPQRHGQNLYAQNIARYDQQYAKDLEDYDNQALIEYNEAGRDFNQNYNGVSNAYSGNQYYEMYRKVNQNRYDRNFLMERENFYHKPQVNLNWYHQFSDKLQWNTIAYWSGGKGGGTGTYGDVETDYSYSGMGLIQWDDQIAANQGNIDLKYSKTESKSSGILRNSVNQQNTYGGISRLFYQLNEKIDLQLGVDYRWAEIDHWREVRDLLGGDYFVFEGSDFDNSNSARMKRLGDKIAYNNTNQVTWLGSYAQAQYHGEKLNLFGMGGFTTVSYDYTDHFTADENGEKLTIETDNLPGFQFKGGASYDIASNLNIYANGGYISRNPIFDYAINDGAGIAYEDPKNEKITTFEAGVSYYIGNKFGVTANYYNTTWSDRTITQSVRLLNGDDDFIFIGGLEQNHQGVEINGSYQPFESIKFDAGGSFGIWEYTNDVNATYTTYENGGPVEEEFNLYLNGLKVGNAPQNQLFISATIDPIKDLSIKADFRYYSNFYSDFNALDRTDESDRTQSWQVPNYGVVDLHAFYNVPVTSTDYSIRLFAHVFNALDAVYIQDATDNSRYNSYDNDHDADDAEVFFGIPRNFNAGIEFRF